MVRQPLLHTERNGDRSLSSAEIEVALQAWLTILEPADWGFCITDPKGNTLAGMNPAFATMHGYTVDELVGQSIEFVKAPEVRESLSEHHRLADERGHYTYEPLHLRKDGTTFPVLASITVAKDEQGAVLYRIVCVQDISERKQAEAALRETERQFYDAFLTGPNVMHVIRKRDGRIVAANERFLERTGCTREEVIGRTINEIGLDVEASDPETAQRELQKTGAVNGMEVHVRLKTGEAGDVLVSGSDVDWAGEPCLLVISSSVTERKRAEEALLESETKFRTITETIGGIAFIIDASSLLYMNSEAERITGYSRAELASMSFLDLIHPDHRALGQERVLAELRGERVPKHYELLIVTKSGEERWLEFSGGRIDYKGQPAIAGSAFDVTERKRTEEALRESEERYRTLVESALDLICEVHHDQLVYVSPGSRDVLGFEPEELIGTSVFDIVDPRYHGQMVEAAETVAESDRPARAVHKVRHKNGEWRWLETVGNTFGEHRGVVISRDITERKQAEEALRESEAMNRALLETVPDVIFRVSREGVCLDLIPGKDLEPLLPPAEFIGRSAVDIVPEELAREAMANVEQALETGETQRFEFSLEAGGALRLLECRLVAMGSDEALAIVREITEQRRAQEALGQSEERFRMLAEHANDMIYRYRFGEDGGFEYVSPSVTTIAGYTPEDYYADPDFHDKIIHPDDKEKFQQSIDDGVIATVELRWFRKDGSVIWAEQRNVFIYDEAGEVVAVQGIIRDITERKRAEEVLQQARDELESRVEASMERGAAYGLTFREFTVLHLLAEGGADKEIALELGITARTIGKHVARILSKMKAASRTEAVSRAFREGLLS
ncbi:MAG: PAS domain S-box protein [Dehalococcoidia bacterium]